MLDCVKLNIKIMLLEIIISLKCLILNHQEKQHVCCGNSELQPFNEKCEYSVR